MVAPLLGWIIQLVLSLVVSVGLSLLKQAQRQTPPDQPQPGVRGSLQVGGDTPLSFIAGRYATGGHLEYAGTWGNAGKTPNAYFTKVISLSDLPIQSLTAIYINGERCTVLWGETETAQGWPVAEYRVGGVDHVWLRFYDGTQTVASAFMVSKFGSSSRPWGSDRIGRGVAYVEVTALVNRELFPGFPDYRFEVDGIDLYDMRLDGTAGGTGSQRDDDQATWAFSDNVVAFISTIQKGLYFDGQWVWGLQDAVPTGRQPYANWKRALDYCDDLIELDGGGTEKRFCFGAEISVDQQPIDVIENLLKSCSGRMAEVGGAYKIVAGDPGEPVYSFTDDDVIISVGQRFDPFPGLQETQNAITATYPEPSEAWNMKEAPPRYSSALEAEDDGRRLPAHVKYEYVSSGTQVQRLMKSAIDEARRFRSHSHTMPPEFWEIEPLDVVAWSSVENGYDTKRFLYVGGDDLPDGDQVVVLKETDPADFEWTPEIDEFPFSLGSIVSERPPAQLATGFSVIGVAIYDDNAKAKIATLRIGIDNSLDDVRATLVKARLKSTGVVVYTTEFPYEKGGADTYNLPIALFPLTAYEAQGKYIPFSARETTASSWLEATTPLVESGLVDGSVGLDQLNDELKAINGVLAGDGPGTLAGALAAIEERIARLAASGETAQANEVRNSKLIKKRVGGAIAAVIKEEAARIEGDTASAEALVEVATQIENDILAGGLMKIQGTVSGSGETASSSIAFKSTASVHDALADAGLYLKAEADGLGGSLASILLSATDDDSGSFIKVSSNGIHIYGRSDD